MAVAVLTAHGIERSAARRTYRFYIGDLPHNGFGEICREMHAAKRFLNHVFLLF